MSSKKPSGAASFAARSLARSLVIQVIYAHLLNHMDETESFLLLQEQEQYLQSDKPYCARLLTGILADWAVLIERVTPFLDRPMILVSPVERAILLSAAYELLFCPDVPHRVVLNEAIEQAKLFGGMDGHRYVNGVLDRLVNEKKS